MTKLKIYNDIHLGSEYNDNPDWKRQLDEEPYDHNTILNGDIVDMSCCPKKDVTANREYQAAIKAKWGTNYVPGNHDLMGYEGWYKIVTLESGNKAMVTHGHRVGNKKRRAKWDKYVQKKPGASWLKLKIVDVLDDMDWLKGIRPIPQDVIDCAVIYAQTYGCKYVVLGHFHPNKKIVIEVEGIIIIFLPKGVNILELE